MNTKKITKNTNTSSVTSILKKESLKVNKSQTQNLIKKKILNSSYNTTDPNKFKKDNLTKTNLINSSRDKNSIITSKINQNIKKNNLPVRIRI